MDNNILNKRADFIELQDFKDAANVYYQQLTKASKQKGLGSHEHIYFTYGIEWAFNHLPQCKNNYDSLLDTLKWISKVTNSPEIGIRCDAAIQKAEQ